MALRKLTLSIDERVIDRARRYSQQHDTSISQLVSAFLGSLPPRETRISPAVQRLRGILPPDVDASEYYGRLEDKYGG